MTWTMTRTTQTCPRAPSSALTSRLMGFLLALASPQRYLTYLHPTAMHYRSSNAQNGCIPFYFLRIIRMATCKECLGVSIILQLGCLRRRSYLRA